MQKVLALVLMFSFFSLFILILLANYSQPEEVPIILLQEHINERVKISGEITRASYSDKASFFRVREDIAEIRVIVFDNCTEIKKGDFVSIKGDVEVYEGKLELIARQISLL